MKFKTFNYIKLLLLPMVLIACTGDFEEVNINPNNPLTSQPNLLLPAIERDMMRSLLDESWSIGNIIIQHTAKNQFVNEDRYLWGERNTIWNAVYDNMRDVNNMLILSEESSQANYKGVALVLRAWMFSLATDAYGDVPYSQSMGGKNGAFFPQYDTQEKIYEGILSDLSQANTLLAGTTNISGDLIYNGDVAKWRMLANSLRLRYLMRISDQKEVGAEMQSILDNPSDNPIFRSNEDHAVYTYRPNAPDQFPLFSARIGSFNEFRASKTLTDKLLSMNDPRAFVFFRPTPATEETPAPEDDQYIGIPNGMSDVNALTYNGGPEFQSRVNSLFYEQATSEKGLDIAKGVIMTYAELQFILAEASEKGLITGEAATFYVNGINASFDFYGLTPSPLYLNHEDVAYFGDHNEKLEKIGTQKWISLFFQGLEAWFDWRRTGYPILEPSVTNQNNGRIPVRFTYPLIEQSLNGQNRAAAVERMGEDDINTRVWWDKN